jgi:hypothetical protein
MEPLVDWCAPNACTLPLCDQPLRMAEWDSLFSTSVRFVSRMPAGVEFVLDRVSTSAASVADLADREAQCCSFLAFNLSIGSDSVKLQIASEPAQAHVVAALAERAENLLAGHARG